MQRTPTFDWDDLRIFLALARHGSTLAAARNLGINQSTVQRRLAQFERRVDGQLVERQPSGYRLTSTGQALVPHTERVEAAVQAFADALKSATRAVTGVVRVTCPEPLVFLLRNSTLIERFEEKNPLIQVQFVLSDKYLDLSRGEADIALRSGDTEDGDLVGCKIADSLWAVYGSPSYLEHVECPASTEDLRKHRLVGFDETMRGHRVSTWLEHIVPQENIVARNDSVLGVLYAVRAGVGLGALPTALADGQQDLVRVLGPIPELSRIWRILAHPSVRKQRAVAAFFDFVVKERARLQSILA